MSLADRLAEHIRACFTGLWIRSHELEDALAELARLCRGEDWSLAVWDIHRGLSLPGTDLESRQHSSPDPLAAIQTLSELARPESAAILVLENFHRFLQSAEIVQAVKQAVCRGRQNRTFLVILSPVVDLPPELEKLFLVLEHELPDRRQLAEIAQGVATEPGELPDGADLNAVLDAAAGLTRQEAENAFSLSLVRHGRLEPDVLWELKAQTLSQSGLVRLHRGQDSFATLGGLEALKQFCLRALPKGAERDPLKRPRGVLLLGVPGTGKSALAKALGNETGRPTLLLDMGTLFGSLVGESERNIRQVLQIADAMAPCILFLDEIEKGLAGAASSGQTDSGVTARLLGSFLTWLNDHDSDVFVIATCNDIARLPPEFARAERFDGLFFLDLPQAAQKQVIWQQYLELFGLDPKQARPVDTGWTGAEIRACCRLAALLDVPLLDAAQNIVPVSVTAAEAVDRLRQWASGRCLSADQPGLYERQPDSPRRQGRRVSRDPSNN